MIGSHILRYLSVILGLSACGNAPTDFPSVSDVQERLTRRPSDQTITAEALRQTMTPEIMSQIDTKLILIEIPQRQAVAIVSLVNTNQDVETYLSADGISISLQGGLIVATRGFGFDLMTADVSDTVAALRHGSANTIRIHRRLDGENQIVVQSFHCDLQFQSARFAVETCRSAHRSFTNSYNLNESGDIVASTQWVSPELGSLEIQTLN